MKIVYFLIIFCRMASFVYAQEALRENLQIEAERYRLIGYQHQTVGDLTGAVAAYRKAIELDPHNHEIYNDLGVVYEQLGYDRDAIAMYKKALEIEEGYLPAYTNLALFYEKKGRLKEAVKYWSKRYRFGEKGEYWREKARERMLAMASYPEVREEVLETEAIILSKELTSKRAQEKARREKKALQDARMHFEVGMKLFEKENYSDALKELEQALYLNPPDDELKVLISDLYVMTKRAYMKQRLQHYTDEAMIMIDEDDYIAASKRMQEALSVVSSFSGKQ